jgi:hypothetical protein
MAKGTGPEFKKKEKNTAKKKKWKENFGFIWTKTSFK